MLQTKLILPEQDEYDRITKLLPTIFPKEELVPADIADDPVPYLCFYDDQMFIGFAQVRKAPCLHYLKYMAILEQYRSKGYGGKMLEIILAERGSVPLALDIEPLDERAANYEQRLRRFRFYRKHGMVDSGYIFQYGGVPFTIMTTGEEEVPEIMKRYCDADHQYAPGFMQILKRVVLNVPELPHPPHKPYKTNPTESHLYTLTLNGQSCPVRKCSVSAHPFNRVWPGKQRDFTQAEEAAFAFFSTDDAVAAEVETAFDFTGDAVIRPLSKKIKVVRSGRKLNFTLPGPGQYVLETGSDHNVLQIFADPIWKTTDEEKKNATYSFGPGIHFPGRIVLKSGDSVYIDPGALVYGGIFGLNVENVRIFGGGILDGSMEERVFAECYEPYPVSTFKFYRSKNIRVQGITILNSACWTMNFFCCSDIEIDRVKITGQWRYNTDGIDLCSVQRAKIMNSFVRSFDDTIVLKALDFYRFQDGMWEYGRNEEDIEVRSCVLWCDWGRTCEVGIETSADEYKNILFEDCDLIHNSHVAIDIQNGCGADIHNVIFRNLRVEYQAKRETSVYQDSDDMEYDPNPKYCVPQLIWSDNYEFSLKAFDPEYDIVCKRPGSTHDILYEDIQVFAEDGIPGKMPVHICCSVPGAVFCNHIIRNLTVNGKKISSFDELDFTTNDDVTNTVIE